MTPYNSFTTTRPDIPTDILPTYDSYGCRVNAISVEDLFRRYQQVGFLYPSKLEQLEPYLPLVRENWRKGFRGGELLLYCITAEDGAFGDWASLAAWRTTNKGWQSQHLVSLRNPMASRSAMLAAQAIRIHDWTDDSYQNWFRPENRFPARVFGSLGDSITHEHSAVTTLNLFSLTTESTPCQHGLTRIKQLNRDGKQSGLFELATEARSRVYAEAEELGQDDLRLESLDDLYARVGLRRYRRVWIAHLPNQEEPVGAALAYRGPLGFNFSFLENRCDLLVRPTLTDSQVRDVTLSLLSTVMPVYADFLPGSVPIVACDRARPVLETIGARFLRRYCQSIWLRDGFIGWYRHVEKFYARAIKAEHRRGLGGRGFHSS